MVIKKPSASGSATIEYALLMPIVFACIFAAIIVMMILYQKTIIQNIAEDTAQSLSRQWGYKPLPYEEIDTGVYKRETYESREMYWNIKFWNNGSKIKTAEEYANKKVEGMGPLKVYKGFVAGLDAEKPVTVSYTIGLTSTLSVDIKVAYKVPGAGLMKLLGMGDYLVIEGHGKASVYDAKDMINTTDYVLQMVMNTQIYQDYMAKIAPLKENLDKVMGK